MHALAVDVALEIQRRPRSTDGVEVDLPDGSAAA
jgi:hypothetical protein